MLRALCRKMCNLTCKKAMMMTCLLFLIVIFASYMVFFNHGAPESIMAENRGKRPSVRMFVDKDSHKNELDKELEEEERKALEHWEQFIKDHDYTAIGEIYDNCDEKDRIMVGRTIMLPDVRWGGIKGLKTRTFINTTLDSELNGGRFFIKVNYNGKELYTNNWELCTLDEDYGDDRLIYCPYNPGEYSFVKDRQIPIYLPKGRYETTGWIVDQEDQTILCGFSDFSL